MIKNYIKIALRNLLKHKAFTIINIIGLTIGISAALVIYLIVNYDFTFDKFEKDNDRIYRVVTNFNFQGEKSYSGGVTGPMADAVKNEAAIKKRLCNNNKYEVGPAYKFKESFVCFLYRWLCNGTWCCWSCRVRIKRIVYNS